MNLNQWRIFKKINFCLLLMVGASMSACAGLFDSGGTSWKEEVLMHDGSTIIVERSVVRGGRHEIGQEPPIKEQSFTFKLPSTNEEVVWEDNFTEDVGGANFLPMQLEIVQGAVYLVAHPMGCISYNKWNRPNPPYVVFEHQDKKWQRISLQELPIELYMPNMIFSSPDREAKKAGQSIVSAETIKNIYDHYKQPEYKSIMRDVVIGGQGVTNCLEYILYKGKWIMPNDPVMRAILDRKTD